MTLFEENVPNYLFSICPTSVKKLDQSVFLELTMWEWCLKITRCLGVRSAYNLSISMCDLRSCFHILFQHLLHFKCLTVELWNHKDIEVKLKLVVLIHRFIGWRVIPERVFFFLCSVFSYYDRLHVDFQLWFRKELSCIF